MVAGKIMLFTLGIISFRELHMKCQFLCFYLADDLLKSHLDAHELTEVVQYKKAMAVPSSLSFFLLFFKIPQLTPVAISFLHARLLWR